MRFILRVFALLILFMGLSIALSGHFSDHKFKADIDGWQARLYGASLMIFGCYLFMNPRIDPK